MNLYTLKDFWNTSAHAMTHLDITTSRKENEDHCPANLYGMVYACWVVADSVSKRRLMQDEDQTPSS